MPGGPERNLSEEAVNGLNTDLDALRGLHDVTSVALSGLYSTVREIQADYDSVLVTDRIPERKTSSATKLRRVAHKLPGIFEERADYATQANGFLDRLRGLITTDPNDGTTLMGAIDPNYVIYQREEEPYVGDKITLPRVYVALGSFQGRVVSVPGDDRKEDQLGVWVWPDKDWRRNSKQASEHIDLLNESVEFVEFVKGCKLPDPEKHTNPYNGTDMD